MNQESHTKLDTESIGFLVLTLIVIMFYGALAVWINRLLLARNDHLRSGDSSVYQYNKRSSSSGNAVLPGSRKPHHYHHEGSALLSPSAVMSGSLPSGSNMPLPSNQKKPKRKHHHGRGAAGGHSGTALNSASPTVGSSSHGSNSASHSKVALVLEEETSEQNKDDDSKSRVRSESQPLPPVAAPLLVEGPGTAYHRDSSCTQGRSASLGGMRIGDGGKLEDSQATSQVSSESTQPRPIHHAVVPGASTPANSIIGANTTASPRSHHSTAGVIALPKGVDLEDDETMVQMAADRLIEDQQEALINPKRMFSDHICQMYLVALFLCLYSLTLSISLMLNTPSDSILATKQTRRETNSVESDWVTLPMATLLYGFVFTLVLTIYESVGVSSRVRTRDTVMVTVSIALYLASTGLCLILGGNKLEEVAMCIDATYSFFCCILCLVFARKLPPQLRFNNLRMLANNTEAALGFNAALFLLRGAFFIPPVQKDLLPSRIEDTLPILMMLNCMPIVFTIVIMRSNRQPRGGGVH